MTTTAAFLVPRWGATFAVCTVGDCDDDADLNAVRTRWQEAGTVTGWFPDSNRVEVATRCVAIEACAVPFTYIRACLGPLRAMWQGRVKKMAASGVEARQV